MVATLVKLSVFRRRKVRERVLDALEQFYQNVTLPLEDRNREIDSDALESLLVQVLGEHWVDGLDSSRQRDLLEERCERFSRRLKAGLKLKLKTLRRFETLQPTPRPFTP
jgi:hypothetical protein